MTTTREPLGENSGPDKSSSPKLKFAWLKVLVAVAAAKTSSLPFLHRPFDSGDDTRRRTAARRSQNLDCEDPGVRGNTPHTAVGCNDSRDMRTMPGVVHWVRIVVIDVIATHDLEAGAKASSKVGMRVVDSGINDRDCDSLAGETQFGPDPVGSNQRNTLVQISGNVRVGPETPHFGKPLDLSKGSPPNGGGEPVEKKSKFVMNNLVACC